MIFIGHEVGKSPEVIFAVSPAANRMEVGHAPDACAGFLRTYLRSQFFGLPPTSFSGAPGG